MSDEGVEPGCQYAKFVMATSVHVQAEEFGRVFGPYQVFEATFDSHEQALTFAAKAPLLDVAIKDVLVVSSLLSGKLSIRFAMTADQDDARGLLASKVSQASAEILRLVS